LALANKPYQDVSWQEA